MAGWASADSQGQPTAAAYQELRTDQAGKQTDLKNHRVKSVKMITYYKLI